VRDARYQQIADDLRSRIERGEYPRGGRLPTEKELMEYYDASRNTIRDAVRLCVNLGLVQPQAGRGTFVTEEINPLVITLSRGPSVGGETAQYLSEVRAELRDTRSSLPRVEVREARVAPELRLSEGATVVGRHQERYLDGRPWSLQTTFYPMDLVTRGATRLLGPDNIEPGAVSYLSDALGIEETGWRDRVIVRVPDPAEATFFQLADDGRVAIMEIRRTAFQASGAPVRLTVTTCPADRNELLFSTGQVPAESW
jgi:GntR family transcriptional regulator